MSAHTIETTLAAYRQLSHYPLARLVAGPLVASAVAQGFLYRPVFGLQAEVFTSLLVLGAVALVPKRIAGTQPQVYGYPKTARLFVSNPAFAFGAGRHNVLAELPTVAVRRGQADASAAVRNCHGPALTAVALIPPAVGFRLGVGRGVGRVCRLGLCYAIGPVGRTTSATLTKREASTYRKRVRGFAVDGKVSPVAGVRPRIRILRGRGGRCGGDGPCLLRHGCDCDCDCLGSAGSGSRRIVISVKAVLAGTWVAIVIALIIKAVGTTSRACVALFLVFLSFLLTPEVRTRSQSLRTM